MGSRQKRSKIANLLFAGGGITAAALLTQSQLGRGPEEVTFQSTDGLTQAVSESLQVDTPDLPVVPVRHEKPQIVDRDVFARKSKDETPTVVGAMVAPHHSAEWKEPEPDPGPHIFSKYGKKDCTANDSRQGNH